MASRPSQGLAVLLVAWLGLSVVAGQAVLGPARKLPETPEAFSALHSNSSEPVEASKELAPEDVEKEAKAAAEASRLYLPKPRLPEQVPERPLVFSGIEPPAALKGLDAQAARKLLKATRWGRRARDGPIRVRFTVDSYLDAPRDTSGDPLYVDQHVNDTKLRKLFQKVPDAFRGVRRQPVAVLARPGDGLQVHALPEPRWVAQVYGKSTWRVYEPEAMEAVGRARGCDDAAEEAASGTVELQPGQVLYVPAKWGWSSCTKETGVDAGFTLAVGAGGYSIGWPDHFHSIADGDLAALKAKIAVIPHLPHVADPSNGMTGLELAAQHGDLKVAKLFAEHGGRYESTGSYQGMYPVHLAAMNGQLPVLRWLAAGKKVPLKVRNEDGKTPLHVATEHGHVDAMKILLENGADVHAVTSKGRFTAVHFAVNSGHLPALKVLRKAGAEMAAADSDGCEPTVAAADNGNVEILEFLLGEEGLSPDARCDRGQTAAHHAAAWGHTEALSVLKKHKANFKLKDDEKRTPLHTAVQFGVISVIDWFATAKVKGLSPKTPGMLHIAAATGNQKVMQSLLSHGADVDKPDPRSNLPPVDWAHTWEAFQALRAAGAKQPPGFLHRVAARGNLALLKRLEEEGLAEDLNEVVDGLYPAHLAAENCHKHVLEWLCGQMGSNCTSRSSNRTHGRLPLHFAALGEGIGSKDRKGVDRLGTVKYLVEEQNSDPDAPDSQGITPVQLAGVVGHLSVVKYLVREKKVDLAGLWKAKIVNKLDEKVEDWVLDYVPPGTYADWFDKQFPEPAAAAPQTPPPPQTGTEGREADDSGDRVEL